MTLTSTWRRDERPERVHRRPILAGQPVDLDRRGGSVDVGPLTAATWALWALRRQVTSQGGWAIAL